MPFQIGALVDGSHRSASEAGLLGFMEVGAYAFGMILISAWVDRVPPGRIAVSGCLFIGLANAGLYFLHEFYLQLIIALLAGFGYGFVFAASIAGAAASREPDRLYAIGNGGALLLIVALMNLLPMAVVRFGDMGVFIALAALPVVCAPLFGGFITGRKTSEIRLASWRLPGAPGLLFAWALFSTGTGSLYAFSERIGKSISLPPGQIAMVLSTGVFVGLLGTGTAAVLGGRVNRKLALIIGMCGSAVSCLLLGFAANLVSFAAGVFAYWIFYMFLYAYFLGTAAVLDPAGRLGTLGGGLERLGYAIGAGIGGILVDFSTYSTTGVLGFAGCMVALSLGFPALFRALSQRRGEP